VAAQVVASRAVLISTELVSRVYSENGLIGVSSLLSVLCVKSVYLIKDSSTT
jgi:hypothetical protein